MSLRINHNIAAVNSHRNLQANDTAMGKTLEKLSSGLKVNRASDGPAALVISEQMRGQIAGLNQAIDNSETAVSMIQTTEANLNEVSRLLTSVRQLSVHAANEGVNDETMLEADQQEINNALATIDRISNQAQFGNKRLLDGSQGAGGATTGENLEFVTAGLATSDSREAGMDVVITQNASKAFVQGTVGLTNEIVQSGETFTVIENGKMASYTSTMDDTVDTALKNLSSEIRRNGLNVEASLGQGNMLNITHKEYGSAYGFQFSSSTAGVLSSLAGEIDVSNAGMDVKGTINGESAVGAGQVLTGAAGSQNVEGLAVKFTGQAGNPETGEIPPEGAVVGRAYVSHNSMNFQVGGNHGQTVGISVESVGTRTLGNNIHNESGFKSLSEIDVRTFQGAQDAMKLIDDSITRISARRGELGAFQKNSLESNLSNLRIASENLTGSESILRDVDMAAEMANYTKNQIMTQSATAMLAQANQTPANVLQLLK